MPLVLNGATSGSTTIQPTDAVTVTLTTPATSGTLLAPSSGVLGTSQGGTGLSTVGTNGQVLTSNGTSLSFTTPSSGAMTLISTQTASTSSALIWTGLSGYDRYFLQFENLKPSTGGTQIYINFGYGSSPTYYTSGYAFAFSGYGDGGATNYSNTSYSAIFLTRVVSAGSAGSNEYNHGSFYITGATNSGTYSIQGFSSYYDDGNPNIITGSVAGQIHNSGNSLTAIQLTFSGIGGGVNIVSGKASLYGISS
jgi:hypothetical protein